MGVSFLSVRSSGPLHYFWNPAFRMNNLFMITIAVTIYYHYLCRDSNLHVYSLFWSSALWRSLNEHKRFTNKKITLPTLFYLALEPPCGCSLYLITNINQSWHRSTSPWPIKDFLYVTCTIRFFRCFLYYPQYLKSLHIAVKL